MNAMRKLTSQLMVIAAVIALPLMINTSSAQTDGANVVDEAFVKNIFRNATPTPIQPAPMKNWVSTIVQGEVLFFSNDGKFLIYQGSVIDMDSRQKVSDGLLKGYNKGILDGLDEKELVVFKPETVKHVVTVFTDPKCGYCRKLHSEMQQYLDAGIEVRYAASDAYGGAASKKLLTSAWCSDDKVTAVNTIKRGGSLAEKTCDSTAVNDQIDISRQLGISGTPAIFSSSGLQIGGYLPAASMLKTLDREG